MATITEIGADIYRINVEMPGKPVTFSLFLIDDDQPTVVETSYRRVFAEVLDAVRTVLDPVTIQHIVIPHFEGDECGTSVEGSTCSSRQHPAPSRCAVRPARRRASLTSLSENR